MKLKMTVNKIIIFILSLYSVSTQSYQGLLISEQELFKPTLSASSSLVIKKDPYYKMRDYFLWWHSLPTIGLKPHRDWSPTFYPFIPHFFGLEELAPKMGRGARIALIDNGVAFQDLHDVTGTQLLACKHPYVAHTSITGISYISKMGQPSWHDYKELISFYTDPGHHVQVATYFPAYSKTCTDESSLIQYLLKYGHKELRVSQSVLSQEGKKALEKFLGCWHRRSLVVDKKSSLMMPLHLCAVPDHTIYHRPSTTYADQALLYANHGTFCAGLLSGSLDNKQIGLAPNSSVYAVKVTQGIEKSYQNPTFLVHALQDICKQFIPIVSLSYSMQTSAGNHTALVDYFSRIPLSCVAVGNKTSSHTTENYLATIPSITARVGSFGICKNKNSYQYPMSTFNGSMSNTQGWYVVMPGERITSCCYNPYPQSKKTLFVTMQGTSCATPLVAALFSLLVAECYPVLTYEQIRNIVYYSTVRLHNTDEWKASGAGTLDMRMALFMGHVLKKLSVLDTMFSTHFMVYVKNIRQYLLTSINAYGAQQEIPILFQEGMIDFLEKARQKQPDILYTHQNLLYHIEKVASDVHQIVKKGLYDQTLCSC